MSFRSHDSWTRSLIVLDVHAEGLHRSLMTFIRRNLIASNVFERKPNASVNRILATRVYLLLLGVALIIILTYTSLEGKTYSNNVPSPNQTVFESLEQQYPNTLTCPCSRNPVTYVFFIYASPILHPICSYSWLQSEELIIAMYSRGVSQTKSEWLVTMAQYSLLVSLCQQGQFLSQIIQTEFATKEILTVETLSAKVFEEQMASATKLFSEQYKVTFDSILAFTVDTFRSNQFQDRYMSSWQTTFSNETENYVLRTFPSSFNGDNCTCAGGVSSCFRPLLLTDGDNNQSTLPGKV